MEWYPIILGLIILDFCSLGFIPWLFRIHPPYRHLLKDGILIEDGTCNLSPSWKNGRFGSVILTRKYLILRDSFLTSLLNTDNNSLVSYTLKNKLFRKNKKKLTIYFMLNGKEESVTFKTNKYAEWCDAFAQIGLNEKSHI